MSDLLTYTTLVENIKKDTKFTNTFHAFNSIYPVLKDVPKLGIYKMLGVKAHESNNDNVTVGNKLKCGIFCGDMNLF